MTDSKDSGSQKPARATARQGEQSVRIPRLQAGGPQKPSRPVKDDDTAETSVDQTAEVVEVEETDVEREEKAATAAPVKGRPAQTKGSPRKSAGAAATPAKNPPRKTAEGAPTAATSRTSGPQKVSARDEPKKPGGPARSGGGAMTAADYARTTRESADSTSVIPAIRDEDPRDAKGQGKKPAARVEPAAAPAAAPAAPGSGRRAELRLVHVEPWSVTKLAFVVSVALMIVSVVAVAIFWVVLDLTGVWDQLNGSITNVLSDNSDSFDVTSVLGLPRLVGLTLVLSAINVVVMTALATIGAHLYNLAAQLLGGIHLTFSDD